ncbi:interferon alpha/beta receptor 1-like [Protopterus annectens]|uniref:interferon alpha/beta receptor 1-like n=1 Tax=Protopterus annectens TaxID=7888 RepID=UPI001CFA7982|nr:interferon alpha/beta receptor 1-like [Protopterus annectens]
MSGHMLSWQAVPGCEHVMVTKCNLPVEIFDYFKEYSIRVKADNGSRVSFSESVSFAPLFNSVVDPPPVILTAKSSIIEIFIADPEEGNAKRIWDPLDCFYIVEYWTKNCEQKRQLSSKVPNITLHDLEPKTQYCLRAKVCNTRCSRN